MSLLITFCATVAFLPVVAAAVLKSLPSTLSQFAAEGGGFFTTS